MKKFIMTFLVAGLIITSVLSLGSCKKTGTNTNSEEWIPTTYSIVLDEPPREGADYVLCYFCGDTIHRCPDNPPFIDNCFYCPLHSHIEWFDVEDDCYDPNQTGECEYKFVRRHRHVITFTPRFYIQSWHVGGGATGGEP